MSLVASSFGDAAPSGENLEYEAEFTALTMAAQPGEERQAGNEIIAAEEPDPKAIVTAAEAILEVSHDLRAAILLGYAKLRLEGLSGLAEATGYLRGCLEDFWDSCHPQLDADDDDDPTMRINALRNLADPETMLLAMRRAPLTQSAALGRFTLRDLAIAAGEVPRPADMETAPDATTISAAFRDTDPEWLAETLAAGRRVLDDISAIDAVFAERLPGQGPALDPLERLVRKAVERLAAETGSDGAVEGDAVELQPPGGPGTPVAAQTAPATIGSRRDVETALERIMDYYASNEPSSPLPILLRRAHRLVGADFMTIMKDIAPDGAENVRVVAGLTEEEAV